MKAVNNNGVITTYQMHQNHLDHQLVLHYNVQNWSEQDMKDNGLFDVIIEDGFDSRIHDLGEIYWDTEATVFKKDKINKTWSKSLADLKAQQINNFKGQIGNKLAATDWYIIRNADNGTRSTIDITDAREALRTQSDTVETEINDLTTKAAVMSYDFPNID